MAPVGGHITAGETLQDSSYREACRAQETPATRERLARDPPCHAPRRRTPGRHALAASPDSEHVPGCARVTALTHSRKSLDGEPLTLPYTHPRKEKPMHRRLLVRTIPAFSVVFALACVPATSALA